MNASESEGAALEQTQPRARANRIRAAVRLARLAVWTAYCYASYLTARALARDRARKLAASYRWTHRWFRGGAGVCGIDARLAGEPPWDLTFEAPLPPALERVLIGLRDRAAGNNQDRE